jgi:hypothetical protein
VTQDAVTVAVGASGEIVRRAELDAPCARYFSDPLRAITAFIAKAEAALADAARRQHHAGWRGALVDARRCLQEHSVIDKDKQWQDRYSIVSTHGKVWKRQEVCKRAVDKAYGLLGRAYSRSVIRPIVEKLADDDTFMRPHTGVVPARIVEELAFAAFFALAPKEKTP